MESIYSGMCHGHDWMYIDYIYFKAAAEIPINELLIPFGGCHVITPHPSNVPPGEM